MAIPLDESDERHRIFVQLYPRTATQMDFSGKRVLKISCDHGGGASYLTRTLKHLAVARFDPLCKLRRRFNR